MNKENSTTVIMDPKNDFVFKCLFGDERHKDLLISLLSSILDIPKEEFHDLEILNNELLPQYVGDRKGILDVRVRVMNGKQIDIEIQVGSNSHMISRSLYYWSLMYASQLKQGDTFGKLKECMVISILDFNTFTDDAYFRLCHLVDKRTGKPVTDLLEMYFVELPKLDVQSEDLEKASPLTQWMTFLKNRDRSEIEVILRSNDDIMKAYEELERLSLDPKNQMLYLARHMELLDALNQREEGLEEGRKAGLEEGRKVGIEQGIEQGIKEATKRLALKLLASGSTLEQVAQLTELSVEEIEALRKTI